MLAIIRLKGGLGNQLFQYAFYLSLKKRHPFSLYLFDLEESLYCHSGYQLDRITDAHTLHAYKWYRHLKMHFPKLLKRFRKITQENSLEFRDEYFQKGILPTIYDGYWQSDKYFIGISSKIRKTFCFRTELLNEQSRCLLGTLYGHTNVSVHIRRGDYLKLTDYLGVCNLEYYNSAIEYIKEKIIHPRFIFFSDDMPWVKEHLHEPNATYVDWNQGKDSWQDMYLMSQCSHNIVANSSFSWWGAWLNNNPDKIVIAPKKWFCYSPNYDILPPNWISL